MNIIIFSIALAFLGMGMMALIKPQGIGDLVDIQFDTVTGRNEARAVYGGFGLTMALALILATEYEAWREGITICVALALAGMAGGRVLAAVIESPGIKPWVFCGLESVAAGVLLYTL